MDAKVKGPILAADAAGHVSGIGHAVVEQLRTRGLPVCTLPVARRSSPGASTLSLACLAIVTLTGCDPIVTIAGATFPSWLLCMIVGAILAAAVRPLVVLAHLEPHLGPLTTFYPSLIAMFAMILWVIFFNRV
jgi:YtcA family